MGNPSDYEQCGNLIGHSENLRVHCWRRNGHEGECRPAYDPPTAADRLATLERENAAQYLVNEELREQLRDSERENAALQERNTQLESALRDLVQRLHLVHSDKRYQSVWVMHAIHSGVYTGPQYDKELKAAELALGGAR